MAIIIFENFDYCCNISFFTFSPLWNKYHDSFNTGLTYKPEVFVLSKNVWRLRGPGVVKIDILFFPYSLINYLVSDAKCVLCFQRIAMLLAPRNLNIMLLISLMKVLKVTVPSRIFSKNHLISYFWHTQ